MRSALLGVEMTFSKRSGPQRVSATTLARLHLGFLDLNGGLGRRFGSVGLALDGLGGRLALQPGQSNRVDGFETERGARYLDAMQQRLGLPQAHHLTIEEAVPPHSGLGSGTQLALAIAAALRRLHGLPLDPAGDALFLDRGARSGVGIGLFETGGLVVDGGRAPGSAAPPIIAGINFPEAWQIILVLDPKRRGAHGEAERAAFRALAPMSATAAAEICRFILMQALPAVVERDIVGFGEGIRQVQQILGDYFAPAQGGGRFTSPDVAAVVGDLERSGACGVGQSSWGPTGFAFVGSRDEAERITSAARQNVSARGLDIRIVSALNRGCTIEEEAGERSIGDAR
jgi:beta-ribofuranosylaminobenzene 5'-phosphate synthase